MIRLRKPVKLNLTMPMQTFKKHPSKSLGCFLSISFIYLKFK